MKRIFLTGFISGLIFTSFNQVKESSQVALDTLSQTNEKVKKITDEIGLVYVDEGAQLIITYDEVNVAQQVCNALVKISELKENDGDYKTYVEEVLSSAYNYDFGKVFFKPTLV